MSKACDFIEYPLASARHSQVLKMFNNRLIGIKRTKMIRLHKIDYYPTIYFTNCNITKNMMQQLFTSKNT